MVREGNPLHNGFGYLVFVFSISQVLVGSAPLKPYGFDKGCKHTLSMVLGGFIGQVRQ